MDYGPFHVRGNADFTRVSTGPKITGTQSARCIKDIEPFGRLYKGARDTWDSNYAAAKDDITLLFRNGFLYVRCLPPYSNGSMPRGFDDTVDVEISEGGAVIETRRLRIVEAGVPLTIGGHIRVGARQHERRRWVQGWTGPNPRTATPKTSIVTHITPGLELRTGEARAPVVLGGPLYGGRLEWYRTGAEPLGLNGHVEVTTQDLWPEGHPKAGQVCTSHVDRCDFYTVPDTIELPADNDARAWGYNATPESAAKDFRWGSHGGDWLDAAGEWFGRVPFDQKTLSYSGFGEVRWDVTEIVRRWGAGFRLQRLSGSLAPSMDTTAGTRLLEVEHADGRVVTLERRYGANVSGGTASNYNGQLMAFEQEADPSIVRATLITHYKSRTGSGSAVIGVLAPLWRMYAGVPLDMIEPVDRVTPLSQRSDVLLVIDTDAEWKKLETIGESSGHTKGLTTHHVEHGTYYSAQYKADTLWHLEVFFHEWNLPDGLEACRIGYFSYIHPNYRRFPGEVEPADLGGKDIGWRGFGANRDGVNYPVGSGGRVATGENGFSQRTGQINHAQHAYPEWHLLKRALGHDGYSYHIDAQDGNGVSGSEGVAYHPYGRWVWIEKQIVMNSVTPTGPMRDGRTAICIDEREEYLDNNSTWRETKNFRENGLPNGVDCVQMNCYLGGTLKYDPEHPWPRAMAHFVITRGTKPIGDPRLHAQGFALPPPPNELGRPAVAGEAVVAPARARQAHRAQQSALAGSSVVATVAPQRARHAHAAAAALTSLADPPAILVSSTALHQVAGIGATLEGVLIPRALLAPGSAAHLHLASSGAAQMPTTLQPSAGRTVVLPASDSDAPAVGGLPIGAVPFPDAHDPSERAAYRVSFANRLPPTEHVMGGTVSISPEGAALGLEIETEDSRKPIFDAQNRSLYYWLRCAPATRGNSAFRDKGVLVGVELHIETSSEPAQEFEQTVVHRCRQK